jgi:hypothetical protein
MKTTTLFLIRRTIRYIVFIAFIFTAFSGCSKKDTTLSPARSIAGTWKASVASTVYYLTTCNSDSAYAYTSFKTTLTFVITAIDDNNVSVSISGDATSTANDSCGQSPPPAGGFPIVFGGTISSSALTLTDYIYGKNTAGAIAYGNYDVGDFTFTTNLLSGSIFWMQYYDDLGDGIGWTTSKISLTKS